MATKDKLVTLEDLNELKKHNDSEVSDLKSDLNYNHAAEPGYVLRATDSGHGNEWAMVGTPTDAQAETAINAWLDAHPEATTTVQDGALTEPKFAESLKLKAIKDYVTPEMFGAIGDGTNDDTLPIQSAFDSGKDVLLLKKYGISDTLDISRDISVICSCDSEILPLENLDELVAVGVGEVTPQNPVLSGLIKVTWYGGKLNCKNGNFSASVGLELGKLYHSKFADISIINVSNTGVKYSGSFGALAICENVAVKGINGTLAKIGFDLRRNDQRLYNCSAIDFEVGFYVRQGYTRLNGCAVWVTHNNNWDITTGYVIDANYCGLVECTCDTVKCGVLFSNKAKTCSIINIFWLCNSGVVSDYTGMRLFQGSDPNNQPSVNCLVVGLQISSFTYPVYLRRYINDDNLFKILGMSIPDSSYIVDAGVVIDPQLISNKSRIIGDWYGATMATSPTTANSALTGTMTLPAGRYVITFNCPYITGLGSSGTACRLKMGSSAGNYHYLKNGWNEGFSEILVLNNETEVYVESADSITHQNNTGSGIRAIRIA